MTAKRQRGDVQSRAMINSITRDDLVGKLGGAERVALVEALGPGYYADAHLPGAVNIPPDQVDRLARELLPDTAAEVVVYASATSESARIVARRLRQLGYERIAIYAGGKEEWVERGLPVEREG